MGSNVECSYQYSPSACYSHRKCVWWERQELSRFDNLLLASEDAFNFEISLTRQPCDPDVSLSLPDLDSATYQWYKEGIALIGENSPRLSRLYGDGEYHYGV